MNFSKKVIALLLSLVLVFGIVPVTGISVSADDLSGYTPISNVSQLKAIRNNPSGKYYLTNNITLSSYDGSLTPIGTPSAPFTGVFDGRGYSISNLDYEPYITDGIVLLGLFGMNNGTIKNLQIVNSNLDNTITGINKTYELFYGVIAAANSGTIENSCVKNCTVKFTAQANYGASGKYTIFEELAGIAGYNNGTVKECFNYACSMNVVADVYSGYCTTYARVGGVVSTNTSKGKVINSYNTSSLKSQGDAQCSAAGVAVLNIGRIEECFNNGNIKTALDAGSPMNDFAGGVVASNNSGATILKSRNRGAVSGMVCVAGVATINASGAQVDKCYNDGKISAYNNMSSGTAAHIQSKAGGISAENNGTITNSFNAQAISSRALYSHAFAGGLVAVNFSGTLRYCYSTGALSARAGTNKTACIGAIAGDWQNGSCYNCYYPSNQKGNYKKTLGKALSSTAIKKKSSYVGFDFTNTWILDPAMEYTYPVLKLTCKDVHFGKWVSVKRATFTANGTKKFVCSICSKTAQTATVNRIRTISLSGINFAYSGKVITPSVVVKDSAGKTVSASNYTVTYAKGRKNVGKYVVTVRFKGLYSGSKNLYFNILPPRTTVSKLASGKKSFTATITKKSAQVTGYQLQYATNNKFSGAKTKTIRSYSSTKHTIKSLRAKKNYYVRVRTYKSVGGKYYYSGWSSYRTVKTK